MLPTDWKITAPDPEDNDGDGGSTGVRRPSRWPK